jgi:hypothetical protein
MTEQEKTRALAHIQERIWLAQKQHLPHTANCWREYYNTVAARPAEEMILARDLGQPMTDDGRVSLPSHETNSN